MSLFIASLAFEHGDTAFLGLDRLGILMGSLVAGACGFIVLRLTLPLQGQASRDSERV
jgi:NhaA family Na+:H+ antiporter